MTTPVDPRWVARHGVRYWVGDTFPEPPDHELTTLPPLRALALLETCADKQGTETGAKRHYRAGEKPCPSCIIAQRERKNARARIKTKTCTDCQQPISNYATRCRKCGSGSKRKYQLTEKKAA